MRIERQDDVAVLRVEGGRANAINHLLLERFAQLVDEAIATRPGALIVTGYDRFFSGGLDLPALVDLDRESLTRFIQRFDEVMLRVFALPIPVVAAINGHAIAGGCVLALQADWRIIIDGAAKIGLNEVQLGIGLPLPVVETLRSQVPASSLVPVALEGHLFAPMEAHELGLVDEVVAPDRLMEAALAKARSLAALPPFAFAEIKRALREPVLAAARRDWDASALAWVETILSEEGQKRLRAAVARLGGPR